MFEGKTIQDRLQNNDRVTTNNNKEALTFARLTEEGKVNKAIKILEKANKGGILPLSEKRFEILQQKHPEASKTPYEKNPTKRNTPRSTFCYL